MTGLNLSFLMLVLYYSLCCEKRFADLTMKRQLSQRVWARFSSLILLDCILCSHGPQRKVLGTVYAITERET